ncbi:hypothetical protein F4561_002703 [Lipingzhangella halophila]|uniref:Uncharacterized protein n=1 Tax=Lipingzhangella halophila TaxID=1783352 RepID=A0A7W7RHW1_9ACTN|nr:hypothetical protein [Lipingzhangella halophila]MBB4931883.1 hypothetical protein [Lipingzhangella halophila]
MKAHELAKKLLSGPDHEVVVAAAEHKEVDFVATYPGSVALLTEDDEVVDIPMGF